MKSDPHSRTARRLVRLVIGAVVLPSILLTGLGLIAVDSERAAAKQRLEEAYKPVMKAAAGKFNASMIALDEQSAAPLAQLVAGSRGELEEEPAALREFVASHPQATNYFVLAGRELLVWQGQRRPLSPEADAALNMLAADLEGQPGSESPGFLERVQTVSVAIGSPELEPMDGQQLEILSQVRERLVRAVDPEAIRAAIALETILEREALHAAIARQGFAHTDEASVVTTVVDDWRRVLYVRRVGDAWAGFELAPYGFADLLESAIAQFDQDGTVGAAIMPLQLPQRCRADKDKLKKEAAEKVLSWALLTRTHLAWEILILHRGEVPLMSLEHNRSVLYLWALVLCVLILAFGIIITLRTVAREARYARLKTDFVSSVSHDLRTPLTSIRMFTETLLMGRVRGREEEKECLQTIAEETERLTRLTEKILDFSRMEAGRKAYDLAPADLGPIVKRAVAACKPIIDEHGAEIRMNIDEQLPEAEVDEDAMAELVINLLTNAIKYSNNGREIDVRLHGNGNGEEVVLEVADQGIGIARSERDKIFEKFYRVDCRRTTEVGGTGIGLSLVRHIVDAHRGKIVLDSAEGVGTTFAVHLPVAVAA